MTDEADWWFDEVGHKIKALKRKAIKLSATAQFSAGKASMIMSSLTLATVLSDHFGIRWLYMLGIVMGCGLAIIAVIHFSGWMKEELTYNANMSDLIGRLERIEKRLERRVSE